MAAGKLMQRIRTVRSKSQRERPWLEDLPMGAPHRIAPATATATADESPPQPAAPTGTHDHATEQMRQVFHELHADGRNAQCAVCDSQYRTT
jgi:hypothetical protein